MPLPKSAQDVTREKREDTLIRGVASLDGVNTILGGALYTTNRFAGVYSSLVSAIARNSVPVNPNALEAFGGTVPVPPGPPPTPPRPGSNWTYRLVDNPGIYANIAVSSNGTFLVGAGFSDKLVYTSSDFGSNWTSRDIDPADTSGSLRARWVALDETGTNVFVAGIEKIYTSVNSGSNWTTGPAITSGGQTLRSIVASRSGSNLFVTATDGLYFSSNSGSNWTKRSSTVFSRIAISANGSNVIAVPSSGLIQVSSDAGQNFSPTYSSSSWVAVASSSNGSVLAAIGGTSSNKQIVVSKDSGATWTQRGPLQDWADIVVSDDGAWMTALVQSNATSVGAYSSTDFGDTWSVQLSPPFWGSGVGTSANGTRIAGRGDGGIRLLEFV